MEKNKIMFERIKKAIENAKGFADDLITPDSESVKILIAVAEHFLKGEK